MPSVTCRLMHWQTIKVTLMSNAGVTLLSELDLILIIYRPYHQDIDVMTWRDRRLANR